MIPLHLAAPEAPQGLQDLLDAAIEDNNREFASSWSSHSHDRRCWILTALWKRPRRHAPSMASSATTSAVDLLSQWLTMGKTRFEWDPGKDRVNRQKHGISFREAKELFESAADHLEIFDESHSADEERFIAVGRVDRGFIVVVWTEPLENVIRIISARRATRREQDLYWSRMGAE